MTQLDPHLASRLHLLAGLEAGSWGEPGTWERILAFNEDPAPWTPPAGVVISEDRAPGPNGDVDVRVYRAAAAAGPLLVWAHGGGFQAGDLDMNEAHMVAAETADRTDGTVVSVGYRLAVDGVRFPVPLLDVEAAWRWAHSAFGGSGGAFLGGASAGAALALAAAVSVRRGGEATPDGLVLAYPFAHFPNPALPDAITAALAALPPLLRFDGASIEGMVRNYVGRIGDVPPLALPGAADLTGLPPTQVLVSELDDLRSSGELLCRQLTDAGGSAELVICRGMLHGHLNRTPSLAEVDRTLTAIADFLLAGSVR